MEAIIIGHGGVLSVARATGISENTEPLAKYRLCKILQRVISYNSLTINDIYLA
ncbi:hypothetical protein [Candidatus Magnetobacterium casense]|uniref:hypothetical protein n=1 Tax=Candidatus Magnetobacterium casense TaxID=1455061 RepID=UPI001C44EEA2|nr:hypothetical protein [Candidatus Magnetobacterium casensis]